MKDSNGRTIDYMRVALIDKCNLKCWYCVGRNGHKCSARHERLSYDELVRILHIAVEQLGIVKLRLTGGEPLLYPRLEQVIKLLRTMPQLRELTLTTNGLLLSEKAKMLHQAGLHRVNVSLEGATNDVYRRITGSACLENVLTGLKALQEAGFDKPKLNVVLCRWFQPNELRSLLEIGHQYGRELRFIELMGFDDRQYPNVNDIVSKFESIAELVPLGGKGTAVMRYAVKGCDVVLGMIPPRTCPFCSDCNRVRLTSDGQLLTCLFSKQGVSLRDSLRAGCSDNELATIMRKAILDKPSKAVGSKIQMSKVGG